MRRALLLSLLLFNLAVQLVAGFSDDASTDTVLLQWDLSARTKSGRVVLDGIVGCARRGKLHMVFGPSGSGKSSMLLAVSGTVPKGSLLLRGTRETPENVEIESVFVNQQDLLFAQLTVDETLQTAVALRAAADLTRSERDQVVDDMILSLSLKKVRGTKVGDVKTRGLSGGEKKRLAVANELLSIGDNNIDSGKELVIYADEVSSGLDSYQAQGVISILRDLAVKQQATVICTIHQPRASVYAMFDDVTLLSEGRVMYSGPREGLPVHFGRLGFACPPNTSPAEHYLDLCSMDYSNPQAERASRERIQSFATAFREAYVPSTLSHGQTAARGVSVPHPRLSLSRRLLNSVSRFRTLFTRSWRQVTRDRPLNIARFASALFSSLLFGAIYWKLGKGAGTVPDRLGLLQVAAVNCAMTSLIKATTTFCSEKIIINRERRSGSYAVFPYFLAKLLAEAPLAAFFPCLSGGIIYKLCGLNSEPGRFQRFLAILCLESFASSALGQLVGSLAPSVESAVSIAPSVMVIFIVFGGLYVVNAPVWLSWVPKTSLIRWAYEALAVNELEGLALTPEAPTGPRSMTSGDQALESMGIRSSIRQAMLAQAIIIAANYLLTFASLVCQRPAFEKLEPPEDDEGGGEKERGAEMVEEAEAEADVIAQAKTSSSSSSPSPSSAVRLHSLGRK